MRTAVRATGFAAFLVATLGASWAAGSAIGPRALPDPSPDRTVTLRPRTAELAPGTPGDFAFTLTGPLAAPPALTVVRGDGAVVVHATPLAAADGTWHSTLTLPAPGPYRAVVTADPAVGPALALPADLLAPGPYAPVPATPSRVAEVDGYQVRLDGDLLPGAPAQVFVTVGRAGVPVTDLEPVDDDGTPAFGRLEAVHLGDLAVSPVHPDAAPPAPSDRAGPGIAFTGEVPAAGTYRLFLDFRHGGVPHSAVFTVSTGSTG